MSLQQFARQRGLHPQRLHRWKLRLAATANTSALDEAPLLLPVRVRAEAPGGTREALTVLLRTGHVVNVSHGFDEETFTRVVALLEGTRC